MLSITASKKSLIAKFKTIEDLLICPLTGNYIINNWIVVGNQSYQVDKSLE